MQHMHIHTYTFVITIHLICSIETVDASSACHCIPTVATGLCGQQRPVVDKIMQFMNA